MSKFLPFFLSLAILIGCEETTRTSLSKEELARVIDYQGRSMIINSIGAYGTASSFAGPDIGGPVGWFSYFPWGYGQSNLATGDTLYYNSETGYWIYKYYNQFASGEIKYRYEPHDEDGYPTNLTDKYILEAEYEGSWPKYSRWSVGVSHSGKSSYSIDGFKDFADESTLGELVFNGSSESTYQQVFSADTTVNFTYTDHADQITFREGDCAPHSGSAEYTMTQDAKPDSFSRRIVYTNGYVDSIEVVVPSSLVLFYEDFSLSGKNVYTEGGVHMLVDGEDYYYSTGCDSMIVTLGSPAKKQTLRKMGLKPKLEREK